MQKSMIVNIGGGVFLIFLSIILIEVGISYLEDPVSGLSTDFPFLVDEIYTAINFLFLAGIVFLVGYTLLLWAFSRRKTSSYVQSEHL